jgi:hypothetical protein
MPCAHRQQRRGDGRGSGKFLVYRTKFQEPFSFQELSELNTCRRINNAAVNIDWSKSGEHYLLSRVQYLPSGFSSRNDKANNPQLKQGFQTHLRESENHVKRLEQVFQLLGKQCFGIMLLQRSPH